MPSSKLRSGWRELCKGARSRCSLAELWTVETAARLIFVHHPGIDQNLDTACPKLSANPVLLTIKGLSAVVSRSKATHLESS
jgi:hypothetical protein